MRTVCLLTLTVILLTVIPGVPAYAQENVRVLATSKTSTMQKEIQEAGDAGFEYRGQAVFKSTFGGNEVVVVPERDKNAFAGMSRRTHACCEGWKPRSHSQP